MLRTASGILGLAASALVASCGSQASDTDTSRQVREASLGVVAAYNRQDAHAAAAFDAPDYVGIFHGSANTVGAAADEAAMKKQMAAAKVDWKLGRGTVTVAKGGDMAVFEAPYTFVIQVPGAPVVGESGTWIAIWRRQANGEMKLWRSIASDGAVPAQPGAP